MDGDGPTAARDAKRISAPALNAPDPQITGAGDAIDAGSSVARKDAAPLNLARALGRMRYQLAAGLLFGVIVPTMLRPNFDDLPPIARVDNSTFGAAWAMLFGYLIFRKVTAFPGARATAYIAPAFLCAYVLVALLFTAMRIDFSRYQFGHSCLFSIITFYAVFFIAQRGHRLSLAVIPVGGVDQLRALRRVQWRFLKTPDDIVTLGSSIPIVVDLRADLDATWETFVADQALAGRPVYNFKQVYESLTGRVRVEHISENPFDTLAPSMIYAQVKEHADRLQALIALVALAPLLALVAILIRLDSPGPALFRQIRIGQGGRAFTVYKFRTMFDAPPAAASHTSQSTAKNDPRITRIGRFLRKWRIDEFPQVLNILRGEMSWIGPRPEAVMLSRLYEAQIPFYRYRHLVRPGITGWAQVNQGHVTDISDAYLKLQYDFYYVKNFSLWLDILVFLRTLRVMFTGEGAK